MLEFVHVVTIIPWVCAHVQQIKTHKYVIIIFDADRN